MTPARKVDTICTLDLHVYSHLDPMDTVWTKGLHECGPPGSGRHSDQ